MDIINLKTFIEVAQVKHFGLAAERLYISQSSASVRIRNLETHLGCQLFVRERNNIQLTPEGEKLLPFAQNIVKTWQLAQNALLSKQGIQQTISIGANNDLWQAILTPWLRAYRTSNPAIQFNYEILNNALSVKGLLQNVLDLALVLDPVQQTHITLVEVAQFDLELVSSKPNQELEQALSEHYYHVDWGTSVALEMADSLQGDIIPTARFNEGHHALNTILSEGGAAYLAKQHLQPYLGKQLYEVKGAPSFARPIYAAINQYSEKRDLIHAMVEDLIQFTQEV